MSIPHVQMEPVWDATVRTSSTSDFQGRRYWKILDDLCIAICTLFATALGEAGMTYCFLGHILTGAWGNGIMGARILG